MTDDTATLAATAALHEEVRGLRRLLIDLLSEVPSTDLTSLAPPDTQRQHLDFIAAAQARYEARKGAHNG